MGTTSVAIIGEGITGLSAAFHLVQLGIEDITLISASAPQQRFPCEAASNLTAGYVSGGFSDNFTRLSQVFGLSQSAELWSFSDQAFEAIYGYCKDHGLDFFRNDRVRIITTQSELIECSQAISEMHKMNIKQELLTQACGRESLELFSKEALGFQVAEGMSGYIDIQQVLEHLRNAIAGKVRHLDGVVSKLMQNTSSGMSVEIQPSEDTPTRQHHYNSPDGPTLFRHTVHIKTTKLSSRTDSTNLEGLETPKNRIRSREVIDAEIVILAANLEGRELEPFLQKCLVPIRSQFSEFQTHHNNTPAAPTSNADQAAPQKDLGDPWAGSLGVFYTANHGHEWGTFQPNKILAQGGSRYILKNAGIGYETAEFSEKIHLSNFRAAKQLLNIPLTASPKSRQVCGLESRPCDELPIVGPMFNNNRLLIATGYMGQGIGMGFMSGLCLAELIATGHSKTLPRLLWPERLRLLPSA